MPDDVVERLRTLIADDGYAATFQTMGQYRSALLQAVRAALATAEAARPAQVVRWAVTLDGEFTDNIFRTQEQAERVKADLDQKHPGNVRKVVALTAQPAATTKD